MLHFIRERAQGWIAWVIIGLLIIPFALWGINQYFGGGGTLTVADVNGTEISQGEFQQAFYEQRSRMQQMLGEQYDARIFDEQIKKRVINDLVNRELLLQYADDTGYRVSDGSVIATIQSIDAFRSDGVFSAELYQQQVRAQGQSPAAFESRVKRLMKTAQLPDGLSTTAFVTDAELDAMIKLQEQKRDIRYLVLPADKFRDDNVATEAALNDYYRDHAEQFMTAEQVAVEYVELSAQQIAANMAANAAPSDEELQQYYEAHAEQYQVPEERSARHILIQIDEGADEAKVEAAKAKAESLLARIKAGESFEELAKANSDDPGSAQQGGDLGFFARGVMEPDFEKAAFALKEGEVSEPVLTSFGYHIIKLEKIRRAESKPFAEVRDELLKSYQKDAADKRYFELAEKLTNQAYETPDSLQSVADKLELELKTSDFFTRAGGKGVLANPRVTAAAYSDEVLKQGYNSEPIEIGENHVVVLRVKEHRPAAQRPLTEVQDQVKSLVIQAAAKDAVKAAGEEALSKLGSGETAEALAKSFDLKWTDLMGLGRQSKDANPAIIREAFRLQRPVEAQANNGGVILANGDYVLIQLNKVVDGDPAAMDKAAREALKGQLLRVASVNSQENLLASLKAKANIHIQADEL